MDTQDANVNAIVMGKVTGPFGLKGWLKVSSFTRPPEKIGDYGPWQLSDATRNLCIELLELKPQGKGLIARLDGVADRDQALALRGLEITVSRGQLPEPESGQYYWTDLEGLQVEDASGRSLGRIDKMLDAGAADVMVIDGEQRLLLPFILNETVLRVDIEAGVVQVDWPADE
jgi:16S rRNA processing protein RimM